MEMMKRYPLKRKILRLQRRKPKRGGKLPLTEILRQFGLPERLASQGSAILRYKNPPEKGIAWYWISRFTRKRDVEKFGTCISCDRPITVETSDCGHFIPASSCGRDLLFDEINLNAECRRCNAWDELHLIGYAKGLDRRYGEGTADKLLERYRAYKEGEPLRDWGKDVYAEKATYYRNQLT